MSATTTRAVRTDSEATLEAVTRHLQRWARTTRRRLRAAESGRPGWDDKRRAGFLADLRADAPGLTAAQLVAVVDAFDAVVARATIPGCGAMPAVVIPGRVTQLTARLDVESLL